MILIILSVVIEYYADELDTAKQTFFTKGRSMSQHGFMYRGRTVSVPTTADIPTNYRFGSRGEWAVREALGLTEPWREGDDPIQTIELTRSVPAIVVPARGQRVLWGIHRGHKARRVGASPFVELDRPVMTRLFTIELVGTPYTPSLVRAYPGEYTPPLPWMGSARQADGGYSFCLEFWRTHAYVYRDTIADTQHARVPNWFR